MDGILGKVSRGWKEPGEKMKLKTLKDFDLVDHKDRKGFSEMFVRFDEIQQEAIEDIKAIQEFVGTPQDEAWSKITGNNVVYSEEGKNSIINYIKWKFNISEEDLK